jgi:hypothetical protein
VTVPYYSGDHQLSAPLNRGDHVL